MILEYKLERTLQGLKTPAWIEDGGYFQKGKTFIGWSPKEAHREYLIPDIATELTPAELIQRVQTLGMKNLKGNTLTNTEIEALINDWVQARTDHNAALLRAASILFGDCYQDPMDDTIYVNGVALTPQQLGQVTAKAAELEIQEKTDNAYKRLQELCDTKLQEAKNSILGTEVSASLLEEYKLKGQLADAYKKSKTPPSKKGKIPVDKTPADKLQLEADLMGKTVDQLATSILQLNDSYKETYDRYRMLIGAFRVKTKSLIASGQVDKASRIIETARGFDITTTEADVKAVFV